MKTGLIGIGRIDQVHLEFLSAIEGVEIVYTSDIDHTAYQQTVSKFNIPIQLK